MTLTSLEEIWEAEYYYDDLRWSSEENVLDLDRQRLEDIRSEISETLRDLSDNWTNVKLSPKEARRIKGFRKKLLDFQRQIVQEFQRRERSSQYYQRVDNIWNPQPKETASPAPDYGLRAPLVATPFYRLIGAIFNPTPRNGGDL